MAAHAKVKGFNLRGIDYPLLLVVAVLIVVGLVMVYSASFGVQMQDTGQLTTYFLVRQAMWAALGAVALIVAAMIPYENWRRWSLPLMAVSLLILLVLGAMGFIQQFTHGHVVYRRWVLGNSVQPTEIIKLVVIIYVAHWLATKGDKIRHVTYGMVPFAIMLGVVSGLIMLQPNMSTALLIAGIAVTMFFVAGAKVTQLIIGFVVVGPLVALLIYIMPYRLGRIDMFIHDPMTDPWGPGMQLVRSIYALQTGGLLGTGLGNSVQKMGFLFAPHTDTIFAVIGEELGLLGCTLIIGLYSFLAYRGVRIAMRCTDPFGSLVATGITSWYVLQAALHIGVVTLTIPATGLTLPFISFGGSSLVAVMAATGVLLSISRGTQAYAR
jgi:cell division protein FtsW